MLQTDDEHFLHELWSYYDQHGRHDLPWRLAEPGGKFNPYKILVSEIMLQQTQVGRVIPKFQQFLEIFPNVQSLAKASLGGVLIAWSGLGYNRRAKFLWQAAQVIMQDLNGNFPTKLESLVALPGVGINTAGAILAYSFNEPVLFIETNVRTVYIHHYFADKVGVSDKELLIPLERTLNLQQPRLFYWALMDYGSHLKQELGNLNKLSKHYSRQSKFEGSLRQIRGQVIKILSTHPYSLIELQNEITDSRLLAVLTALEAEGLIVFEGQNYHLA